MKDESGKIPYLPERLTGLGKLSLNLWWRWNRRARLLLRSVDPVLWSSTRHNPVEMLIENFGDRVFNTRIRKTVRLAEAPVAGSSVLAYEPTGAAASAYRSLAREVLDGAQAREHA